MDKMHSSYKSLYYLSLIPILGLVIVWLCAWLKIYNRTKDRKYVFLHFLIWAAPLCFAGGFVVVSVNIFMGKLSSVGKIVCGIIIGYVACLVMSISCVSIFKCIMGKYNSRIIE